jgi:hypothetical protein
MKNELNASIASSNSFPIDWISCQSDEMPSTKFLIDTMALNFGVKISVVILKGHFNIENICRDENFSGQPNNGHQSGKWIENDQHTDYYTGYTSVFK